MNYSLHFSKVKHTARIGWSLLFCCCLFNYAHDPQLVVDLTDSVDSKRSSNPNHFVQLGSSTFFSTTRNSSSIWYTDGTDVGTQMLLDNSDYKPLGTINNKLIIDGLYATDGTSAGIQLLSPSFYVNKSWVFGNLLLMTRNSELWVTDGSPEGTMFLQSLNLHEFCFQNGANLIFSTSPVQDSWDLWQTDGTTEGTELMVSLTGSEIHFIENLADVIVIGTDHHVVSVSKITFEITEIMGDLTFSPESSLVFNNEVYFMAENSSFGLEVWVTDGTAANVLKDIEPGTDGSGPDGLFELEGELFFFAGFPVEKSLWKSDGSEGGTVQVSSGQWSDIEILEESISGKRAFLAFTPGHDKELWVTNGLASGTELLLDSIPGPDALTYSSYTVTPDGAFFALGVDQLWLTDLTPANTQLVKGIYPESENTAIDSLFWSGQQLYFSGNDDIHGFELWVSDGTLPGTNLLKDIYASGTVSSNFEGHTSFGGRLFAIKEMSQNDPNIEFYNSVLVTAGTPASSHEIESFYQVYQIDSNNHNIFYSAFSGGDAQSFFSYDPESDSLTTLYSGNNYETKDLHLLASDSGVYFSFMWNPNYGLYKFYYSDGTVQGTFETNNGFITEDGSQTIGESLYSLGPAGLYHTQQNGIFETLTPHPYYTGFQTQHPLYLCGNHLFFMATDPHFGAEPWVSDGTPEGTYMLMDMSPGTESSDCESFVLWQNSFLFLKADAKELWKTDLTAGGTQMITNIERTSVNRRIMDIAPGSNHFFLHVFDEMEGDQLWISKGTEISTYKLANIMLPEDDSFEMQVIDDVLFFNARTYETGQELWRSDGTIAGTALFEDIEPGPASSSPGNFQVTGSNLFFTAWTEAYGTEWWRLCFNPEGTISVSERTCISGAVTDAHVDSLGPEAHYSWTIQNGEILAGQGTNEIQFQPNSLNDVQLDVNVESLGGCSSQGSVTLPVDQNAPPSPGPISGFDLICSSETGLVYTVAPLLDIIAFQWHVPDGAVIVSGQGTQEIVVDMGLTEGEIRVQALNGCGLSAESILALSFKGGGIEASAGVDQDLCGMNTTLEGNPTGGVVGEWLIMSGVGGVIEEPANPFSNFHGLETETYRLRWTLNIPDCGLSVDDVFITFSPEPSVGVDAGPDVEICGTSHDLAAQLPDVGSGFWTCEDPEGQFDDPFSPTSRFSGEENQAYQVRWNIFSGSCDPTWDELTVILYSDTQLANPGPYRFLLDGESCAMKGVIQEFGDQEWSITGGPNQSLTQLVDTHDPQSVFSPSGGLGSYELLLTNTNGTCPSNSNITVVHVGTPYNTPRQITQFPPSSPSKYVQFRMNFKGESYFNIDSRLWKFNGTEASLESLMYLTIHSSEDVHQLEDTLYFLAGQSVSPSHLWKMDETTEAPVLALEFPNGSPFFYPQYFTAFHEELFFFSTYNATLCKTNGTEAGTAVVANNINLYVKTRPLAWMDQLFFWAWDSTNGTELWKSDGTESGTGLLKDIYLGSSSSAIKGTFLPFQDHLYFLANSIDFPNRLWKTDGTINGTERVLDELLASSIFQVNHDALYFAVKNTSNRNILWRYDGVTGLSEELSDIEVPEDLSMFAFENSMVFLGSFNGVYGVYRLSSQTTVPVLLLETESSTDELFDFQIIGEHFFVTGNFGRPFIKSDGTPSGTSVFIKMGPNANSSAKRFWTLGGNLFFEGHQYDFGRNVWRVCSEPDVAIRAPEQACLPYQPIGLSVPDAGVDAIYQWSVTGAAIQSGQGTANLLVESNGVEDISIQVDVEVLGGCINTGYASVVAAPFMLLQWWRQPSIYDPVGDLDQNMLIDVRDYVLGSIDCQQ